MRVALINNFYPPEGTGGAERVVQKMADKYLADGHEVIVITTARRKSGDYYKNLKIIRFRPLNI